MGNMIISLDLNRLADSIGDRFVENEEFEQFKVSQFGHNEIMKEEQSKTLKECIDLNQEINEININIKQLQNDLNSMKEEIINERNKNEENMEKEEIINDKIERIENDKNGLIENAKNEWREILDSELTKYEIWLKSIMTFFED